MLEGKLAVLRFQIKIKEDLEAIASRLESPQVTSESAQNESRSESNLNADTNFANTVREKARDLSLDLKSITQLYNEYAVPFELWEVLPYPHFLYLNQFLNIHVIEVKYMDYLCLVITIYPICKKVSSASCWTKNLFPISTVLLTFFFFVFLHFLCNILEIIFIWFLTFLPFS